MKKLLLSLAMVATMGISVGAAATVDIDDGSAADALLLANELSVPTGGLIVNSTTNQLDISTALGFGTATGVSRAIRIDLTNATFNDTPLFTIPTCAGDVDISTNGLTPSVGVTGDARVIFEFDNTCGADLTQTTELEVLIPSLAVDGNGPVSVQYRLYESSFAATTPDTSPAGADESDTLILFADAVEFDAEASMGTEAIDVTQDSLFFDGATGDDTTPFGEASLALASPAPSIPTGGNIGALTSVDTIIDAAQSDLTIEGNFASAAMLGCNNTAGEDADDVVSGTTATLPAADTNDGTFSGDETYTCIFETDGTSIIQETTFSLSAAFAGDTGYDDLAFGPFTISTFDKNGSSAEIDILFNAGATSSQIRILNKSSIDGDVSITLINDGGDSVTFPLSAVQPFGLTLSNTLAAGEATPNLPVSALIMAARTVDAAFAQTSFRRNKYRVVVDAEFGSAADPVRVQAVNFSTTLNALSVN